MALLVLAVVLLTGCEKTVYRTNLEVYCPPLKSYSTDFNEILAAELDVLDEGYEAIPEVVTDYIKLRDRIRVCEQEKDNLDG